MRSICLYFLLNREISKRTRRPPAFSKIIKNRALARDVLKILMIFKDFLTLRKKNCALSSDRLTFLSLDSLFVILILLKKNACSRYLTKFR